MFRENDGDKIKEYTILTTKIYYIKPFIHYVT